MIILVRHGETDLNSESGEGESLRGWLDIPINAAGMKVIQNTAEVLRKMPIYKIYCSDLNRTVQTAEAVGEVLRQPIFPHPAFRPWDVGDMSGKPLKQTLPQFLNLIDHPTKKAPGGESYQTFLDRFVPAIKPLIAAKQLYAVIAHARNIIVVEALCHGDGNIKDPEMLKARSGVEPGGALLVRSDWTHDILNPPAKEQILRPKRADKQAVLYMHEVDTDYQCKDCILFISDIERCEIHAREVHISPTGGCGLFARGKPRTSFTAHTPSGSVTPLQSGYIEHKVGFTCARCEYFLSSREDCQKVDPESAGDDPGAIKPGACCNAWEAK